MPDVINHVENTETGQADLWITIKDASDLLGISERHAWNIILENGFKRKKLLNKSRKKTYVLRPDIEKFYKEEQERQRLEALKTSPLSEISEMSEISEKNREFEMSESGKPSLSESQTALSERDFRAKNLPALISEMQKKQEVLLQQATKWRVTTIWISILGAVVAGFLALYLVDTKNALSEREMALSERDKSLSESQKALYEMSEREKQAIKTLSEREIWIKELERSLPEEEVGRLNARRGK